MPQLRLLRQLARTVPGPEDSRRARAVLGRFPPLPEPPACSVAPATLARLQLPRVLSEAMDAAAAFMDKSEEEEGVRDGPTLALGSDAA